MRHALPFTLTLVLAAALAAQTAATPDVLLKAAMQKEQIDNDLPGAIAAYKAIVEKYPKSPDTARALLQLGGIYLQQLKEPEAREAFERVIRDFGGHESAIHARRVLATLPSSAAALSQRLLLSGSEAAQDWSAVSPDGRYLSFVDDQTGNVAVWDISARTARSVTSSKGFSEGEGQFSAWSPNGLQLAYSWFHEGRTSLRVIPSAGGQFRIIFDGKGLRWLRPLGWAPDGRTILVQTAGDAGEDQLDLVSVDDGLIRTIKRFSEGRRPSAAAFSPNGRFIIYDLPESVGRSARDIFAIDTDGKSEIAITRHEADDAFLACFPDGRHVLFSSDRTGAPGAWIAPIDQSGRPSGEAVMVRNNIGSVSSLGFSKDGKFHATTLVSGSDVYVAALDSATGKVSGSPKPLPRLMPGVTRGQATWSPKSDRIAYAQTFVRSTTLAVQTIGTGAVRIYPLQLRAGFERPIWRPDGSTIVLEGVDLQGRQGLFEIDLSTGAFTPLVQWAGLTSAFANFAPDGSLVYARYNRTEATIRRRTGATDEVLWADDRGTGSNVLSPDGRWIAFWRGGTPATGASVSVGPVVGGERRPLVDNLQNSDNEIAWTHDSQHVLFVKYAPPSSPGPRAVDIWRVSVNGGAPEPIGFPIGFIKHINVSPDGRNLAVSVIGGTREIWMWENVLPKGGRR